MRLSGVERFSDVIIGVDFTDTVARAQAAGSDISRHCLNGAI
jgi:hypothetical protein